LTSSSLAIQWALRAALVFCVSPGYHLVDLLPLDPQGQPALQTLFLSSHPPLTKLCSRLALACLFQLSPPSALSTDMPASALHQHVCLFVQSFAVDAFCDGLAQSDSEIFRFVFPSHGCLADPRNSVLISMFPFSDHFLWFHASKFYFLLASRP
jgi:hypothetical protein